MTGQDIALVIGAIAGLITVLGNTALIVFAIYRQSKMGAKMDVMHDLVNGQSQKLEALAFKAGGDEERENPTRGS